MQFSNLKNALLATTTVPSYLSQRPSDAATDRCLSTDPSLLGHDHSHGCKMLWPHITSIDEVAGFIQHSWDLLNSVYDLASAKPQACQRKGCKKLTIMVHGSAKKMAHVAAARRIGTTTPRALFVYKHFQNTSSDPQGQDPSTRPNHSNTPTDDSYGIASIPVLRSRRVIPLEERTCVEDMNFGAGKIRILPIWNHLCLMIRIGCSRSCKIVSDPGLNVWTIPSIAMAEINWCLLLWRQNLKRRIDMLPYIATKPHLAIRLQYSKR
jgi:hypothetical protein